MEINVGCAIRHKWHERRKESVVEGHKRESTGLESRGRRINKNKFYLKKVIIKPNAVHAN